MYFDIKITSEKTGTWPDSSWRYTGARITPVFGPRPRGKFHILNLSETKEKSAMSKLQFDLGLPTCVADDVKQADLELYLDNVLVTQRTLLPPIPVSVPKVTVPRNSVLKARIQFVDLAGNTGPESTVEEELTVADTVAPKAGGDFTVTNEVEVGDDVPDGVSE
jgi:hypothetical protein